FSGAETGFYRAARIRLVLDALGGDRVATGLLWLANRPTMFVTTSLVGTNLGNYSLSLAIVMATSWALRSQSWLAELVGPILLAPVLFVYGELVPKYLFLHAPNRLLRRVGPAFLTFTALFLPISLLLWFLNRMLAGALGQSPEKVRLRMARRELRGILEEGHDVGILYPAQKKLAAGIFVSADHTVLRHAVPLGEVPRARAGMSKAEICGIAGRLRLPEVPIEDPRQPGDLTAYVRVIDLALSGTEMDDKFRPMITISAEDTPIEALIRMHAEQENMGRVIDAEGRTLGVVYASRLRQQLVTGHAEKKLPPAQHRGP
ncbi:MAG: CNNM domain-containing protein, partial [Thermoguttaceae bacterium]